MSIQSKFQAIAKLRSDQFNVSQIIRALKNTRNLQKSEISANRTLIQDRLLTNTPKLIQAISSNLKAIPIGQHQQLAKELNQFLKWMPINRFNSELNFLKNQIIKTQQQAMATRNMTNIEKVVLQNISNNVQKQTNVRVNELSVNPIFVPGKMQSGIQQQIEPIRSFLQIKVPQAISTIQNAPKSIKLLNQYAVSQGYQQMGSTSDKPGRTYIGRYTVQQGNQQYVHAYPKNKVKSGQSPNIAQNFSYYAGNAINSWNGFVESQNKMMQFIQKVSSKQKRRQYVQQKISTLNKATFAAQQLSTMVYYYVQIPIEIFAKYQLNQYDGTLSSFKSGYKVGSTLSKNPFMLTHQQGLKIMQELFQKQKTPQNILQSLSVILSSFKTTLNQSKMKQFAQYLVVKTNQALNYFTTSGISQQAYNKILYSKNISPQLKMKKFILPSPYANNQIIEIIQKVQNENKNHKNKEKWELDWGAQYIPCHDYVWNYNI